MSDENSEQGAIDRRAWLGGAAVASIGVVGGAIAGAATASAQSSDGSTRREKLILDVACDGTTLREQAFPDPPDPGDRRGSPFSVEGWMYQADTVSDGFILTEDEATGRWFCAGFFIQSAERPEPHINAQANFVLGSIAEGQLFPVDTLITYGLGGTGSDERSNLAVMGGTGRHLGAMGQTQRWNAGLNNTALFPNGGSSPNFRYEFELLYPL
jgi:hypothetical protein